MQSLISQFSRAPNWIKILILTALPPAGYFSARVVDDYKGWLALGPGGLPYSLRGYLLNVLITAGAARKDTKSLGMYDRPEKYSIGWKQSSDDERARGRVSFLREPLPSRSGRAVRALPYTVPHRQKNLDHDDDPELKEVRRVKKLFTGNDC